MRRSAQEYAIERASAVHGEVRLLEGCFVSLAMHLGRHSEIIDASRPNAARARQARRARASRQNNNSQGPMGMDAQTWDQMDQVNLGEELKLRVPTLHGVPRFLQGELRGCFLRALERLEAVSRQRTKGARPEHGNFSFSFRGCSSVTLALQRQIATVSSRSAWTNSELASGWNFSSAATTR